MSQSQLQFILCGGTGINIGKDLKTTPGTKLVKEAEYLALDTSDSNSCDGLFELEHMSSETSVNVKAEGSGKDISLNYDRMTPFVTDVFKRHKPAKHVVVISSGAGGTGAGMGLAVIRYLLANGVNAILVIVSDFSSLIEQRNSVKVLQSYHNQTQARFLGKVIPFIRAVNMPGRTWGEVNKELVNEINYLSLFLADNNDGFDNEDIRHLFQYSSIPNLPIPPALSEISFVTDEFANKENMGKPPVSYCSLHDTRENVYSVFPGAAYRATGVINPDNNPPNNKTIVLSLDHGEAFERLKKELEQLDESVTKAKASYVKQEDIGADANDDGSCF